VIYDDSLRPETTGTYCLRALGGLVEVVHARPGELDRLPRAGFDLYLGVDDGLDYRLPPDLRPAAWWAIYVCEWCHRGREASQAEMAVRSIRFVTETDQENL
jgi:hypothetical protein